MLALCPCFEGAPSEFAESGTNRHEALKDYLQGSELLVNALDDEDREGVLWAAEYIRLHAPLTDYPARFEQQVTLLLDNFEEMRGTPDVVCHLDLFDLKWRFRDYGPQMAAYAWARLQELDLNAEIRVHVLYAAFRRAEVYTINEETARAIVMPIVRAAQDPTRQPAPCDYCSMCAHRLKCAALNTRAQTVAAGREDWKLQQYHTSAITEPAEMSKALALARQLKNWIQSVEFHAKEMVQKQGLLIPGWELKSKAGKASCHDMTGAFNIVGLPVEIFLKCAELRMERSKQNASKEGLVNAYAEAKGIPKTHARRELRKKLESCLRTPAEIKYLKPTQSHTDEDNHEEGEE